MLLAGVLGIQLGGFPHHDRQFKGVLGQLQLARFDPGQVQDVAEQGLQRLARGLHQIQHLALIRRQIGLGQSLRQADYAVQGRADLVAHIGQELRLGDIGRLGGVARLGQSFGVAFQVGDVVADDHGAAFGRPAVLNAQPAPAADLLLDVG